MAPRGIYRERNGWGNQHSVLVDYGKHQMDVPEEKYRANGYQPPFDELPWKGEVQPPRFPAGSELTIGYFAEPSAPGVLPMLLSNPKGNFANLDEALAQARSTADNLGAYSFEIDFPDDTSERYIRDGANWKKADA